MGSDVPDIAARATAKSAAPKRSNVSISGSHAAAEQASAQDVIYTKFLEKTLPILRTPRSKSTSREPPNTATETPARC